MAEAAREFPDAPRVAVGGVVLDGDRVLLVRRGQAPSVGRWSIPGGLVHLGERLEDAVVREIHEESGLHVRVLGLCGVIDRVIRGDDGAVRYHYVIVDYVSIVDSGVLRAGSDAAEAHWVPFDAIPKYDVTDGVADMVRRAFDLRPSLTG